MGLGGRRALRAVHGGLTASASTSRRTSPSSAPSWKHPPSDDSGALKGERLTRVPRGFPSDHPAAEFLTFKQYLAWREFPGDFAVSPRFYRGLLDVFRAAAPLVRYLNTALTEAQ